MTTRQRIILNVLVAVAIVLFVIGVTAPIMTIRKLVILDNTFSILGGVGSLYAEGEWLLAGLIGGFSVLLPIIKLSLIATVTNLAPSSLWDKLTQILEYVGKWSMLDVFVVAVILATIKLGAIVTVEIHRGLHAFAASVLASMIALFILERLRKKRLFPAQEQAAGR